MIEHQVQRFDKPISGIDVDKPEPCLEMYTEFSPHMTQDIFMYRILMSNRCVKALYEIN